MTTLDRIYAGEILLPEQVDFSNFIHYINCPRFWFYKNMLGLALANLRPSINLGFGGAIHGALEAGYNTILQGRKKTSTISDASKKAFDKEWKERRCTELTEEECGVKTPERAYKALDAYWKHYEAEHAAQKIHYAEMPFSIPVESGLPLLYGTVDLVSEDLNRLIVSEHKTTKSFSKQWQNSWANSFQLEAYSTAAFLYFNRLPDVCVNGLLFQKSSGPNFMRVWFRHTESRIQRFLEELRLRMHALKADTERLVSEMHHESIMSSFPRNPSACHQFRTCQYYDICPTFIRPYEWRYRAPVGWTFDFEGVYTNQEY